MRSERINFLAVVTAVAGLIGFIGVYAKWFSYEYQVESGVGRSSSTARGSDRRARGRGGRSAPLRLRLHPPD